MTRQKSLAFIKQAIRLLIISCILFSSACALRKRVPVGAIPASQPWSNEMKQKGAEIVVSSLKNYPLDNNPSHLYRVNSVMSRLFQVIDSSEHWQIFVVQNSQFNAYCAPGNFIVVYSGLLEMLPNDDELAVVLAHEISHDLARHPGNPGIQFLQQLSVLAAQAVGERTLRKTGDKQKAINQAKGVAVIGAGLLVLPYSRDQESEADQIGVFLMAEAGFNPDKSVNVWMRQAAKSNDRMNDFMGTHPASASRASALAQMVPLAKQRYVSSAKSRNEPSQKNFQMITRDNPVFNPNTPSNSYVARGTDLLNAAQYQAARQNALAALQIDSRNVFALNNLAAIDMRLGSPQSSKNSLEKALKLAPYNAASHYNMACVQAALGNQEAAFSSLRKAVDIDPKFLQHAQEDSDLTYLKMDPRFKSLSQSTKSNKSHPTYWINRFN